MMKLPTLALAVPLAAGFLLAQTSSTSQSQTQSTSPTQTQTTPSTTGAANDHSWEGTLVDASCVLPGGSSSSMMPGTSSSSSTYSATTDRNANRTMDSDQAVRTGSTKPSSSSSNTSDRSTTSSSQADRQSSSRSSDTADRMDSSRTSSSASSRTESRRSSDTSETPRSTDTTGQASRSTTGSMDRSASSSGMGSDMGRKMKSLDRSCGISDTTTQYGVIVHDRVLKLDDAGNAKVAQEIRSNPDFGRASSGEFAQAANDNKKIYRVTVTGSMENDMLHVDSIKAR